MTDRDPTEPPADPRAADPTAYLPSVGADLPYDPRRRPVTPPAYRDPRTRLEAYRDPDGPADLDRPAPRRRPASRDDEYPISYEGTTALVVICALAVLLLLAVVWWVAASR